ncbi:MAG: hypothetical protein AAB456_00270 [Patescibacteria group bacterium]|mgnify:CR=1 FL=1
MSKLTLWGRISNLGAGFTFEHYNRSRLLDWSRERRGQEVKIELTDKSKPKSEELLGYYYGAVLPAIVAHNKNIPFDPLNLDDLLKQGRITRAEIDDLHYALMTEFRPIMFYDLKNQPQKQRGEMKFMDNREAALYVNEVTEWMASNGMTVPDPVKFKEFYNRAPLLKNG